MLVIKAPRVNFVFSSLAIAIRAKINANIPNKIPIMGYKPMVKVSNAAPKDK